MQRTLKLGGLEAAARLARTLAPRLSAGDTLCLQGPVGAGKTEIARRIIQTLQSAHGTPEDVPSPTFTLVQTYEAGGLEVWHADLYRLSTLDELHELGLFEAMETSLVLIEWPERMGELAPAGALTLRMSLEADDSRSLRLEWSDAKWNSIVNELEQALAGDD